MTGRATLLLMPQSPPPLPTRPLLRGHATGQRFNWGKLLPPARPKDALIRQRLLLELAEVQEPIILLMAPAGFGKTCLMTQLHEVFQAQGHPVAWISLDERDNDFSRFYTYIREAFVCLNVLDRSNDESVNIGENSFPDIRAAAFNLVDTIASSQDPFTLFLDDFEAIQSPEVISFWVDLIRALSPGQSFVIGSRSMRTLPLSSFLVGGKLRRLDAEALSFDQNETTIFFSQQTNYSLSESDIALLREKTEGWAAALRLVTLALPKTEQLQSWIQQPKDRSDSIAQYLAENVLARLPEKLCNFLLATSILELLDGGLCDAVLESQGSHLVLNDLYQANLFVTLVGPAGQYYKYHSLFRSFLQAELCRVRPQDISGLHRKAAVFLRSDGRFDEAIPHAIQSEDIDLAVDILDQNVLRLVQLGQLETVTKWIDALPKAQIANRPGIQRARAYTMTSMHRYAEAEDAMNQLARLANEQGAELDSEAVVQYVLLYEWMDRYDLAEREIARMLQKVPLVNPEVFGISRNLVAMHAMVNMDHERAADCLAEARSAYKDSSFNGDWPQIYTLCFEGVLEILLGNVRAAIQRFEIALKNATGGVKLVPASYLADALYSRGDLVRAGSLAEDYLRLNRTIAPADFVILSFRIAARVNFLNGNLDQAETLLTEMGDIGDMRDVPRLKAAAWLEKSRIALLSGNAEAASRYLSLGSSPRIWNIFRGVRYYSHELDDVSIASIRIDLVMGNAETAAQHLATEIEKADTHGRSLRRLRLQCLLAQVYWRQRKQKMATELLTHILQIGASQDLVYTFADEPWCLTAILEAVAGSHHKIPLEYLNRVQIAASRVSIQLGDLAVAKNQKSVLTLKETAILKLVADGKANKEIARVLNISDNTVETHLRRINFKFETKNRTQAVTIAREQGLLR